MSRVAAVGDPARLQGLRLAGVLVLPASDAAQARSRWAELPDDVALVILTAEVAPDPLPGRFGVLTVVMPT
jgi:vacuolar-type H+-ATPase subunit F/Vma7